MWHRLLLLLRLRSEFDWAPPALGPEVNHPYQEYEKVPCCVHCGGGCKHPIHRKPFDVRRLAEIIAGRNAAAIQAAEVRQRAAQAPMIQAAVHETPVTVREFVSGGRPVDGPRTHLGSHPLTETTCDYFSCWCHLERNPAPAPFAPVLGPRRFERGQ